MQLSLSKMGIRTLLPLCLNPYLLPFMPYSSSFTYKYSKKIHCNGWNLVNCWTVIELELLSSCNIVGWEDKNWIVFSYWTRSM